jgi:hypothetical protein
MVLIGGVVATLVSMGILAVNSSPPSQEQIAQAQQQYDQIVDRCLAGRIYRDGQLPPEYETLEEACHAIRPPLDAHGANLRDLPDVLLGIATFVILLGTWLGASLAGADWTNNTMATLLTWEPRRILVLLARALVVAVVVGLVTVALQAFFAAAFTSVAKLFGTAVFVPSGMWREVGETIARVTGIGIAMGLVAYAVAMIGRSTVASLGVLFGYLVLVEGVIAGFRPTIQPWLLIRAAGVVISQIPMTRGMRGTYEPFEDPSRVVLSVGGAWQLIAVYVVVLLVLALVVFRRRDVN